MAEPNWMATLKNATQGFYTLTAFRQLFLLLGLSVSVAVGVAVVFWSQTPEFRPLYSHAEAKHTDEIIEALGSLGIAYQLDASSGRISVPKDQLSNARIELAKAGVPKRGSRGFDALSQQRTFGVSGFIETARYWHALEEELSQTVSGFGAVRRARVHLAIPKTSVLVTDTKKPSASVLVELVNGAQLDKNQVEAIEALVASSVQGLSSTAVTVVDSTGRLLSEDGSAVSSQHRSELAYKNAIESSYVKRIQAIVDPALGVGKTHVQVTADVNFSALTSAQLEQRAQPKGAIQRLSVAVVVDDRTLLANGRVQHKSLTPDALQTLKTLVENAVGYQEQRGDVIDIVNRTLGATDTATLSQATAIWQQTWFWSVLKSSIAGLIILLLVMFVLKPMLFRLAVRGGSGSKASQRLRSSSAVVESASEGASKSFSTRALSHLQQQGQWSRLKQIAQEDPKRIAQVMRTWVGDE